MRVGGYDVTSGEPAVTAVHDRRSPHRGPSRRRFSSAARGTLIERRYRRARFPIIRGLFALVRRLAPLLGRLSALVGRVAKKVCSLFALVRTLSALFGRLASTVRRLFPIFGKRVSIVRKLAAILRELSQTLRSLGAMFRKLCARLRRLSANFQRLFGQVQSFSELMRNDFLGRPDGVPTGQNSPVFNPVFKTLFSLSNDFFAAAGQNNGQKRAATTYFSIR